MIAMDITEILHPDLVAKFVDTTNAVNEQTYPDGIRSPEATEHVHALDNLTHAAQLPPYYVRSLLELCRPGFTKERPHEKEGVAQ